METWKHRHAYEKNLLSYYDDCFSLDYDKVQEIGTSIPLPTFTEEECLQICEKIQHILLSEDSLLHLRAPIHVIGDIHGNILDLIRVFIISEFPPQSKYLFLGDFVDRGPYSVEVVMLLFIFKIIYPNNVFLIRGNHEFRKLNEAYGFKDQVIELYGSENAYEAFNSAFDCLPFAAIIDDKIFCVHGGISPDLEDIREILYVQRPYSNLDNKILKDIIWSDPSPTVSTYKESLRGYGYYFGEEAVNEFLDKFGFERIIRAHQCVKLGIEKFSQDRVFTVFSSSNYENEDNRCGIIFVSNDCLTIKVFSLPALESLPRNLAICVRGVDAKKEERQVHEISSELSFPKCKVIREIPKLLYTHNRRRTSVMSLKNKGLAPFNSLSSMPLVPSKKLGCQSTLSQSKKF